MAVAKITDTGSDIVLSCDLKSAASVSAAGGTYSGVTFTDNGFVPGTSGITFTISNSQLQYSGQIVCTVNAQDVCDADDGSSVSGSRGINRMASGYVFAWRNGSGTNTGRLFVGADNRLEARTSASDTAISTKIVTHGKNDVELCVAWKGDKYAILVNGAVLVPGTRS